MNSEMLHAINPASQVIMVIIISITTTSVSEAMVVEGVTSIKEDSHPIGGHIGLILVEG